MCTDSKFQTYRQLKFNNVAGRFSLLVEFGVKLYVSSILLHYQGLLSS